MLDIENTALAVIDVQGKLSGLIHDHEKVQTHIQYFIEAAKSFSLPVLWSEQAPDKIGATIKPIKDLLDPVARPIPKRSFSCYGALAYVERLQEISRRQILITGIETHVCVYQTAHDLHRHGYEVHLVADATSSRKVFDRDMALARMRDEGIIITTTEMAMCELIRTADHPRFKEVVSHLKRR
ncbi:MAG: hydrolase [Candidatus Omnitrophica bacterium]|nr:hydrolase [Candidatus Omnitrophota bacterium]MDE2009651.1 hydrolase [Candidatus Omnitrophota bacterium]MDE2214421.1 hydrolase [Candidatus Omnitrophota bacterium]MDE2231561.1 hydrolase [Candidatus Omnitrophota bacterium]